MEMLIDDDVTVEELLENCWAGLLDHPAGGADEMTRKMRAERWRRETGGGEDSSALQAFLDGSGGGYGADGSAVGPVTVNVNGWDDREEGELEEGEIKEDETEGDGRIETRNYDGGVGGSVNDTMDMEEGEFVESVLLGLEMPVDNDVAAGDIDEMDVTGGVGESKRVEYEPDSCQGGAVVDPRPVMEEGEFVESVLHGSEMPVDNDVDEGAADEMDVMGGVGESKRLEYEPDSCQGGVVEDSRPVMEEGEFVESVLLGSEMPSYNGVAAVDEMKVMSELEEGECVETDSYMQQGISANEVDYFHAEDALPDPGLAETLDVAKSSVPVESLDSPKALPSETDKPLDLSPHAEAPQPMKISEEKSCVPVESLDSPKALPSETDKPLDLSPHAEPLQPMKISEEKSALSSTLKALEFRASEQPNMLDGPKLLGANELDSVMPMLVECEDPKTPQGVQRKMQKVFPRRSVSAVRTFPPGCGKNAPPLTIEKHPNSVGCAPKRSLSDVKNNVQNKLGQTEKSAKSPLALKPTLSGLKVDKEIGSSHKKPDWKSVSTNSKMSIESRFPGKDVDRNRSKVAAKHTYNPQAQTVASNRQWNPGKQACRSPSGPPTNARKCSQNTQMHEMKLQNTSKPIFPKRNREEVSSGNGPLVPRSQHRVLGSNMSGLCDLDDKVDDIQSDGARNKVRKTLRLFQTVFRILTRDEERRSTEGPPVKRIDMKVYNILKDNQIWVNTGEKTLGSVPGVEVGDEFHYRVELVIIGLHSLFQGGIDSMNRRGKIVATSIVASGGYDDDMDDSDVLVYSGQGGNPVAGCKVATDQKLEKGNLALKNSMDEGTPVRVIRGSKEVKGSISLGIRMNTPPSLTYDGLYFVEKYWIQKGPHGNKVFMFQLRRMEGQPELPMKEIKKSKKGSGRVGICVKDISGGKEKIPIAAVNTVDTELPPAFEYITKMIHPRSYNPIPSRGCQCKDVCSSSSNCSCAMKNGGGIPFDHNGAIVESKSIVYECGPHCRCSQKCHNRVSQRGIMYQLELFKTKSKGWGVRCLTSISSGSFICEYTGEFLDENDAEKRTGNDEYLFDIGRSNNDHDLWEGLSTLIPSDLKASSSDDSTKDDGFTIDAARCGNVGRFINHSCSPNLYAQNVLYDHDDKRMPHIMLFAAENIPPLTELTYHYNMAIDQVYDCNGNVKKKKCYCGSSECTGRMY